MWNWIIKEELPTEKVLASDITNDSNDMMTGKIHVEEEVYPNERIIIFIVKNERGHEMPVTHYMKIEDLPTAL